MISEILDAIRFAKNGQKQLSAGVDDAMTALPGFNRKSVARGASDTTFQFPILISNTIPLDMAATVARTMERVYASFCQQWLSVNQQIDLSRDKNPVEFLKRFHNNIRLESVIEDLTIGSDDYHAYIEGAYNGEYDLYMTDDKSFGILFNRTFMRSKAITESHKELLNEHLSEFNLKKINLFTEAPVNRAELLNNVLAGQEQIARNKEAELQSRLSNNASAPVLLDKDVKKSNDILPYQLQVRLIGVNGEQQFVQYIDFILGIKAILHPIRSEEMIFNVSNAIKNKSLFFKLLRWTSGEISMIKNILLNIDDVRSDAASVANGGSRWFPTLKRLRSQKGRINPRTMTVNGVIPNTTFVLTQYECDQIMSRTGMDIRQPRFARNLIQSLFLMAVIIVDDGSGTIDVMFDSSSDYQTYNLDTLERETSLSSNKIGKEIGRMLSK